MGRLVGGCCCRRDRPLCLVGGSGSFGERSIRFTGVGRWSRFVGEGRKTGEMGAGESRRKVNENLWVGESGEESNQEDEQVLVVGETSEWLIKGGVSMLTRGVHVAKRMIWKVWKGKATTTALAAVKINFFFLFSSRRVKDDRQSPKYLLPVGP